MTVGTKEFQEMIYDFENSINKIVYISSDFTKEDKELWSKGHIYRKGELNNAFKIFSFGYANSRVKYM